jgi:hypothetical protein
VSPRPGGGAVAAPPPGPSALHQKPRPLAGANQTSYPSLLPKIKVPIFFIFSLSLSLSLSFL